MSLLFDIISLYELKTNEKAGCLMSYKTTNHNQKLAIVNLAELEHKFSESMELEGHKDEKDFILGGAGDELSLRANSDDFNLWSIVPSVMNGLYHGLGDTTQSLLGVDLKVPIITSASAAHGLVHQQAEKATLQGSQDAGTLMTISTYSNELLSSIHHAAPSADWFYQHSPDKDEEFSRFLLDEAVKQGAKAIVIGVYGADFGRRERDLFNQFDFPLDLPFRQLTAYPNYPTDLDIFEVNNRKRTDITPEAIAELKAYTGLPVIIKGIQSDTDALRAIDHGADAIWVSNTGGRQLDGTRSTIKALPEISKVVQGRVPIIFDSGIRRGQHIFKALALGADVVAIGRPALYGLHLGGAKGVTEVIQHLQKELLNTMLLSGVTSISELKQHARLERN